MNGDLSVWNQHSDERYWVRNNWWSYWEVIEGQDGRWYWRWVDEDGWNGAITVMEIIDESAAGFRTWQEAALDAQTVTGFFD